MLSRSTVLGLMVIFAVLPPQRALSQADSLKLTPGMRARVKDSKSFGPSWHEGTLVRFATSMRGTESGPLLGFAPTEPAEFSVMSLDAPDSLEVWLPRKELQRGAPASAASAAEGEWRPVPREQRRGPPRAAPPKAQVNPTAN